MPIFHSACQQRTPQPSRIGSGYRPIKEYPHMRAISGPRALNSRGNLKTLACCNKRGCISKQNLTLTIASLLSVLFMTFHLADDIVRGMEPGTLFDLIVLPIVVVQLYGTLVLAGKRSGYVILLLVSLLELVIPVIHMKGAGVGRAVAQSNGAFFFIWTLLALGVTALFSVILSARALWEHLPRRTAKG